MFSRDQIRINRRVRNRQESATGWQRGTQSGDRAVVKVQARVSSVHRGRQAGKENPREWLSGAESVRQKYKNTGTS